jgi:hypothetical protein
MSFIENVIEISKVIKSDLIKIIPKKKVKIKKESSDAKNIKEVENKEIPKHIPYQPKKDIDYVWYIQKEVEHFNKGYVNESSLIPGLTACNNEIVSSASIYIPNIKHTKIKRRNSIKRASKIIENM